MFPMLKKSKSKKQAKKKSTPKKKVAKKKAGKVTLNFKVKPERAKQIKAMADKFTKGNVTALVESGLSFVPKHGAAIKKMEFRATTRA